MKCDQQCQTCRFDDCIADEKGNVSYTKSPPVVRRSTLCGVPPLEELVVAAPRAGVPWEYWI